MGIIFSIINVIEADPKNMKSTRNGPCKLSMLNGLFEAIATVDLELIRATFSYSSIEPFIDYSTFNQHLDFSTKHFRVDAVFGEGQTNAEWDVTFSHYMHISFAVSLKI